MTHPVISKTVRRIAPVGGVELPDFFTMIDRQASMVVNLAKTTRAILRGKESVHSIRLLELEQRRQELRRRNQAAINSPSASIADVPEITWTMDTLDRVAASLFRAACEVDQGGSEPDETSCQMIEVIEAAAESLQQGYGRLANGSPVAEFDAQAATAREQVLASDRSWRVREAIEPAATEASALDSEHFAEAGRRVASRRACRLDELHAKLAAITLEVTGAGAMLKRWSRRLFADWHEGRAESVGRQSQPVYPSFGS